MLSRKGVFRFSKKFQTIIVYKFFILNFLEHPLFINFVPVSVLTWRCQNKDETSREIQLVEKCRKWRKVSTQKYIII